MSTGLNDIDPRFPDLIEQMYRGKVCQRWEKQGEAMDGSGVLYMHRSFDNSWDRDPIQVKSEGCCFTEHEIKQLLAVPQTFARSI